MFSTHHLHASVIYGVMQRTLSFEYPLCNNGNIHTVTGFLKSHIVEIFIKSLTLHVSVFSWK